MNFNDVVNNISNTFNSLLFIGDIAILSITEFINYCIFRDYKNSIYRFTQGLATKNILYVKMFQSIALNKELIDETINQEIIKYSDSVPYTDDDIDWKTFYDIIDKYNLYVDHNNEYPINSGMISLVFKLYKINNDNNEVFILKMKRRNIDNKLNDAIERLKFFVDLLSYIPWFNTLDIPLLFNKNIAILKEQLDFQKEIDNTNEMRNVCKINNFIKIPIIYEEVNKEFPNAIMMEYIDGKHISYVDKSDYYEFAKLVLKYGFITVGCHGIFHGDLHAGNILFIKNDKEGLPKYQLGIIDFGIIMRIDEKIKNNMLHVFSVMFTSKPRELSTILFNSFLGPKGVLENMQEDHKNNILEIIENVIIVIMKKSNETNQSLLFDFIINFNNYLSSNNLKKYGIRVNEGFIKMQMGIAMAHGISMILCEDKYMDVVDEVLNEIFHLDVFVKLLKEEESDYESEEENDDDFIIRRKRQLQEQEQIKGEIQII
jgi:predicted unusual protein kinase regulating ubiquinone biosynthesis (AarF/ABC1/UbiB family)